MKKSIICIKSLLLRFSKLRKVVLTTGFVFLMPFLLGLVMLSCSGGTTASVDSTDLPAPTVVISTNSPLKKDTPGTIVFAFSEEVNGFTKDDVKLSNSTAEKSNVVVDTTDPKIYTLSITPKMLGDLTITVPANSFTGVSSGKDNSVSFDETFKVITTYTITFKLNGGSFLNPQVTSLEVNSDSLIDEQELKKIVSYPATGPKPDISSVTRDVAEWRTNGIKYDLSKYIPTSDMVLETVWSNSCGNKVETFHPANKNELKAYIDKAVTATSSTTNLNHIDTSSVTSMVNLFENKSTFNGNISCWNTARVTTMNSMFAGAMAFNQPIGGWDVSSVTSMGWMLQFSKKFNQDIGNWDVSSVTSMIRMFYGTEAFNQDISSWDVGEVASDTNWDDVFKGSAISDDNKPIPPE